MSHLADKSDFTLNQQHVNDFQSHGAVLLKGVFSNWVDTLTEGIEKTIANPSERQRSYETANGKSGFFNDFCNWQRVDEINRFVLQSRAGELAAQLMQASTAQIFHDHILVKEPGASTITPWHQDAPYYCVESKQTVSFWLTLDSIAKERSIQFVAGSHRWNKTYKPQRFDGTDLFEGDSGESIPDINSKLDELEILQWDMQPGDVAAFDFRTIHGAPANHSEVRRRAISTRWVGDEAVFVVRPGNTSPNFPDLEYQTGDPFGGDAFPVVFRA